MTANIWNSFGIRTSPFFQEALDLSPTSTRPIDLFVGRAEETEQVLKRILGSDSSRMVISGPPGVGKTTFIQQVKARLHEEHGMAVSSQHCRVPHDLSATMLGVEMLRGILRSIRLSLPSGKPESVSGYGEVRRLVEETERVAFQWSVSVLGSGGGFGGSKPRERPAFLPSQFHDALAGLVEGALAEGITGIVVHLNNLENLEDDPSEAAMLFRDARDYFLVPGVHVLLGATDGFRGGILNTHAQVRSIFPPPVRLEPLSLDDLVLLLHKRLDALRLPDGEVVPPVQESLVREIYGLFRGDLRGMFGALDEACFRALGALGAEPLGIEEARVVLAPLYTEQLQGSLSDAEISHLATLVGSGLDEFRQADVIRHLGLTQGTVSKLFRSLERAQAIVPTRSEGRSQFFSLGGRVRLAFGWQ